MTFLSRLSRLRRGHGGGSGCQAQAPPPCRRSVGVCAGCSCRALLNRLGRTMLGPSWKQRHHAVARRGRNVVWLLRCLMGLFRRFVAGFFGASWGPAGGRGVVFGAIVLWSCPKEAQSRLRPFRKVLGPSSGSSWGRRRPSWGLLGTLWGRFEAPLGNREAWAARRIPIGGPRGEQNGDDDAVDDDVKPLVLRRCWSSPPRALREGPNWTLLGGFLACSGRFRASLGTAVRGPFGAVRGPS